MDKKIFLTAWASVAMAAMGCGSVASTTNTATTPSPLAANETEAVVNPEGDEVGINAPALMAMDLELSGEQAEESTPEPMVVDASARELRALPQAPWQSESVEANDTLVAAWQLAANRSWCAPMTTTAVTTGIRGQALDGGWAAEFDREGSPGLTEDGEMCEDCGHATFGIAGTAMGIEDGVQDDVIAPSFADGGALIVETGDGVAAATVTVPGQGCVYQVWSFLGEAHLRAVVDGLRFVATDAAVARAE